MTGEPGGTLRGSFHNPERNWTGGAPWFRISVAGDRLRFVDPRTGRERLARSADRQRAMGARVTARQIDVPGGSSDGYGWHRYTLRVGDRELDEYEASGNGGQFLVVVPALDLVVVFTGGNYGQYPIWRTYRDSVLTEHLLPAVAAVR